MVWREKRVRKRERERGEREKEGERQIERGIDRERDKWPGTNKQSRGHVDRQTHTHTNQHHTDQWLAKRAKTRLESI